MTDPSPFRVAATRKTEAEIAHEFKGRLAAALLPVATLCDEIEAAGFDSVFTLAIRDGKFTITKLKIIKEM